MAAGIFGVMLIIFFGFFMLLALAVAIFIIIAQWKVFEKAGKPGWSAIIPYYNCWVLYDISGVNPIFSLFLVGGNVLSLVGNMLSIFAKTSETYNFGVGALSVIISLSSSALSIASIVFTVIACINLAKCFKKEGVFGLGLAFLAPIFYAILAFDKNSEYHPIQK